MDVAILDYGAGNLASVLKAFGAVGATARTTADANALGHADAIVVPGVGHFDRTQSISAEQRAIIRDASDRGVALLGICLGLQWLFEGSDEAPDIAGLGLFQGQCFCLANGGLKPADYGSRQPDSRSRRPLGRREPKVPHVGWNTLTFTGRPSALLAGIADQSFAYFTHSFAVPVTDDTTATATHGQAFASVVERDRVFGVQFHPEKSGPAGLRVLSNFIAAAGER